MDFREYRQSSIHRFITNEVVTDTQARRFLEILLSLAKFGQTPKAFEDDERIAQELGCAPRQVRKLANDINAILSKYFSSEGKDLMFRARLNTLAAGRPTALQRTERLTLVIEENHSHPMFNVRKFWLPHIPYLRKDTVPDTTVVYTELRFFRSRQHRLFVRHLDVNDDTTEDEIESLKAGNIWVRLVHKNLKARVLTDSLHFTTAGEVELALRTSQWFSQERVVTTYCPSHKYEADPNTNTTNAVLLGNVRTHKAIRALIKANAYPTKLSYRSTPTGIARLNVDSGCREELYTDFEQTPKDPKKKSPVFALLTRFPTLVNGRYVTVIEANHGRSFQALSQLLFNSDALQDVLHVVENRQHQLLPEAFQMLFSVDVASNDQLVGDGSPTLIEHAGFG